MPSAAQRRLADVRKRFPWWDDRPVLHLLVYPTLDGIKLSLKYSQRRPNGMAWDEILLEATWQPHEVSQLKIVDWAQRGLAAYLAAQLEKSDTE